MAHIYLAYHRIDGFSRGSSQVCDHSGTRPPAFTQWNFPSMGEFDRDGLGDGLGDGSGD